MENSLEEIKIRRKKLCLTQNELARSSNVSQSLIAKIESKNIDPTFSKTQRIFETLNILEKKISLKAKDIMNRKIISVKADCNIKEVIKKMRDHGISQMPVIGKEIKGRISESNILDQIQQGKNIAELKVKDVMDETPPVLSEETEMELITNTLKYNSLILISKYGKLTGLITKADVLKNISR